MAERETLIPTQIDPTMIEFKKDDKPKKKVRPIVPSIRSIEEYRRLYSEFIGMNSDDMLYESYRISLDKGIRKSNITKLKAKHANRVKMQKASRKRNSGTKKNSRKR
jgi:hypothetical protein